MSEWEEKGVMFSEEQEDQHSKHTKLKNTTKKWEQGRNVQWRTGTASADTRRKTIQTNKNKDAMVGVEQEYQHSRCKTSDTSQQETATQQAGNTARTSLETITS